MQRRTNRAMVLTPDLAGAGSLARAGAGRALAACAMALAGAAPAGADVVYETNDPFGSIFGLVGFDVFAFQSVGVRFTPDRDYRLDGAKLWIMSNDFSGPSGALVGVTIHNDQNDAFGSIPGKVVLDAMSFNVTAVGWDPVLEPVTSGRRPLLRAGVNYWIVAMCDVELDDPVWVWAANDLGFTANTSGDQTTWQPGGSGAVAGTIVEGTPACAADCDQSTGAGVLDFFDFICFQDLFSAGDPDACQCDTSTGAGVCDFFDFICFQDDFAAGC